MTLTLKIVTQTFKRHSVYYQLMNQHTKVWLQMVQWLICDGLKPYDLNLVDNKLDSSYMLLSL